MAEAEDRRKAAEQAAVAAPSGVDLLIAAHALERSSKPANEGEEEGQATARPEETEALPMDPPPPRTGSDANLDEQTAETSSTVS